MLRVIFSKDGTFSCLCDFASREIPRKAGFRWNPDSRSWYTESVEVAGRLREYADPSAKEMIDRKTIRFSPYSGPLPHPENLSPYDFQYEAARFALSRNRSYLGLEAGLGKTIVANLIVNALETPTVYISPAFLARNIEAEFAKWSTYTTKIGRFQAKKPPSLESDILIVPDSILHRPATVRMIQDFADLARFLDFEPLLIVDEAHRFKTPSALRTKTLFGGSGVRGLIADFPRQVYLSGTPMPNRPIELYPVLSKVAPETIDFMSYDEYGMTYCAGYYDGYGYDFSGASNLTELKEKVIGKFMLRLRKREVLTSLPPKTEELVIVGDLPAKLVKMDRALLTKHSPEDLMNGKIGATSTATYRRELGIVKVKPAIDFIRSLLDEGEESLLVFAYHTEVIANLVTKLAKYRPLVITGKTPERERHQSVKTFQTDKTRRLFIGNYLAMGLGFTLTKATRVVFVEFSWVPEGENDQASDRAHRIGQTEPVHVQYLIYENSIDKTMMETNFRKRKITSYL